MINIKHLKEVIPSKTDLNSILLKHCNIIEESTIENLSKDLMNILKISSEESWINGYTSALIDSNNK